MPWQPDDQYDLCHAVRVRTPHRTLMEYLVLCPVRQPSVPAASGIALTSHILSFLINVWAGPAGIKDPGPSDPAAPPIETQIFEALVHFIYALWSKTKKSESIIHESNPWIGPCVLTVAPTAQQPPSAKHINEYLFYISVTFCPRASLLCAADQKGPQRCGYASPEKISSAPQTPSPRTTECTGQADPLWTGAASHVWRTLLFPHALFIDISSFVTDSCSYPVAAIFHMAWFTMPLHARPVDEWLLGEGRGGGGGGVILSHIALPRAQGSALVGLTAFIQIIGLFI